MSIEEEAADIAAAIMEEVEQEYGKAASAGLIRFVRDTIVSVLRDASE